MTTAVTIPHMLARLVDGPRTVQVEAATALGAIEAVVSAYPELRVHIFDEAGSVRPHVSCFHNGDTLIDDQPLSAGDTVTVLQAVSGG